LIYSLFSLLEIFFGGSGSAPLTSKTKNRRERNSNLPTFVTVVLIRLVCSVDTNL
jgi:hypothetical protein